jgi:hypothetical protein
MHPKHFWCLMDLRIVAVQVDLLPIDYMLSGFSQLWVPNACGSPIGKGKAIFIVLLRLALGATRTRDGYRTLL